MSKTGKMPTERKCEILGVLTLGITTLLFLCLITDGYTVQDSVGRNLDEMTQTANLLGAPGALLAGLLAITLGDAAHVLYVVTFIWGLMLFRHRPIDRMPTRILGLLLLTGAVATLLQLDFTSGTSNSDPGGIFGVFIADSFLVRHFRIIGVNVLAVTMATIGILLTTDFLFIHLLIFIERSTIHLIRGNLAFVQGAIVIFHRYRANEKEEITLPSHLQRESKGKRVKKEKKEKTTEPALHLPGTVSTKEKRREELRRAKAKKQIPEEQELPFDAVPEISEQTPPAEKIVAVTLDLDESKTNETNHELKVLPTKDTPKKKARPRRRKQLEIQEIPFDYVYPKRYKKPEIAMLEMPEKRVIENLQEQLRATSTLLEETLQTFGIEARVTDVTRGPTITRFEIEPAPGIKVSRFLALSDDLALALKAQRIRVEAPIPGKGRVGIEVPNQERDQVLLRELLECPSFSKNGGILNLALGKDIAGEVLIADLAAMPHLLVAGATGAGKTVCIKSILASMLFSHTPDELQLMLIDPKMVELSIFNDIPHLITPVVTEPKKASTSLNWLITEMEERYRLFAELRVRNINVYNDSVDNGEIEMEPSEEDGNLQSVNIIRKLPYIVCVIDELADLMMLARAEVEDAIGRLAQLARAVGIHLIIATQRPSVDVLTGVIKANFPARLSFQVSSRVDSRCILDEIGAERLIGMGDLLYLPAGQSKPYRVQGAFVSDDEMNKLISYLKTQAPPQYKDEIENFGKPGNALVGEIDESDPLFDEAVQVVLDSGQASISMVQRRLRVGYTRAARLIDMMEVKKIIGPHIGSKARDILVSSQAEEDVA